MQTYQEFQQAVSEGRTTAYVGEAIAKHLKSVEYTLAVIADEYDAQRNVTINNAVQYIYSLSGKKQVDFTASNNRIASNFFHRLNNQRVTYSLGNGVLFDTKGTKEKLGNEFDNDLFFLALNALKHGTSFGFWNVDHMHVFPLTEFVPLWDEENGSLRAGIRYWCIDKAKKPTFAVLYEEDGYTKYRSANNTGLSLKVTDEKRAYRQTVQHTEAGGDEVIGEENYGSLPIIPLYANRQKQSTLVGMRAAIDSYDMIQSGFANDLVDCAQVYWIIGNAMGMDSKDVQQFLDRMRLGHVAMVDTDNSSVTPYTQEIPFNAREAYLNRIQSSIYRDFGAFNPEAVAAGQITATQIRAAYQAQDEEADAFEYEIIEFTQKLLSLIGLEGVPQFKRGKVSNELEQVQMVVAEAPYLDDDTVRELLPNITPDMQETIRERIANQSMSRLTTEEAEV